jgi:hypothetical protein
MIGQNDTIQALKELCRNSPYQLLDRSEDVSRRLVIIVELSNCNPVGIHAFASEPICAVGEHTFVRIVHVTGAVVIDKKRGRIQRCGP